MEHRILHLTTRFINGGGAEAEIKNAIEALQEQQAAFDIRLGFGEDFDQERVDEVSNLTTDTVSFDSLRHMSPMSNLVAVGAVARYLRENEIDLIHTHTIEAGHVGRWAAALARTPRVIHEYHGDPFGTNHSPYLNKTLEILERTSATISDSIIVNSQRIREGFLDRGIGRPEQYHVVYDGIQIDQFQSAEPLTSLTEKNATVFLFVGRLEPEKGVRDLLQAFSQVHKNHDVKLLFAGQGPLKSELERKSRELNVAEDVELLGYRSDIPRILASADVLVLPSYREGTPRAITEALATGLPVVATDIAGIPEQVTDGESGYLIQPGDVDTLAERLGHLAASKERLEQLSGKAKEEIDRFRPERTRQGYREVYTEVLQSETEKTG